MSSPPDSDIPPGHGLFPIRHVCAETGINPVTLRAWERRYGLIRPLRTPKGHRLYSARDIDRIRRILALLDEGVAVSQVGRVLQREPAASAATDAPAFGADGAEQADRVSEPRGGVAPHVLDPVSETLLKAADALSPAQLERTYARLVMRHGWEGVHDRAFLQAYAALREQARWEPEAEARLAVFAAWAAVTFAEQLRAALLLCEGPYCPALLAGSGHRRIGGMLFLLASARQGLRVLPLLDAPSPAAMHSLGEKLGAPAIVVHAPAAASAGIDLERVRAILTEPGVPCYLSGPGARELLKVDTERSLITLPDAPLQAADTLSRQILGAART
jgi:MerR family transcriptional regulator, light-induced transcriptional regulator